MSFEVSRALWLKVLGRLVNRYRLVPQTLVLRYPVLPQDNMVANGVAQKLLTCDRYHN